MKQIAFRMFAVLVVVAMVSVAAFAQEGAAPAEKQAPQQSAYELAQVRGLNTFCKLADVAGLAETLKGEGPMTVFAPKDTAFAAMGEEQVNALLADAEAAKSFVNRHIIPSKRLLIRALPQNSPLTTAAGTELVATEEEVTVDGAPVTVVKLQGVEIKKAGRIFTSNGMLYEIDAIIPEAAQ